MYKIHYFSSKNGEREFVVISDQPTPEINADFCEGNNILDSINDRRCL